MPEVWGFGLKKTDEEMVRGWYGVPFLLLAVPPLVLAGYTFGRIGAFLSEPFWKLLVVAAVGMIFLLAAISFLRGVACIRIDPHEVAEWSLFRRRRIRWEDVREIGLACAPNRGGYGQHPEQWRGQAFVYVSPLPLTDAERVGHADCKVWIAFPYCNELLPANARDQRIRDAMVRCYPGSLPAAFHGLRQIVYPAYVVRSEQPDGTFAETSGEIPNPDEVYYSLRNAG